jgi:hypothetical protein
MNLLFRNFCRFVFGFACLDILTLLIFDTCPILRLYNFYPISTTTFTLSLATTLLYIHYAHLFSLCLGQETSGWLARRMRAAAGFRLGGLLDELHDAVLWAISIVLVHPYQELDRLADYRL